MVLEVLSRVIKIKAFKLFFVNFFLTTIYNNKKRLNLWQLIINSFGSEDDKFKDYYRTKYLEAYYIDNIIKYDYFSKYIQIWIPIV